MLQGFPKTHMSKNTSYKYCEFSLPANTLRIFKVFCHESIHLNTRKLGSTYFEGPNLAAVDGDFRSFAVWFSVHRVHKQVGAIAASVVVLTTQVGPAVEFS